VDNFLIHAGILDGEPTGSDTPAVSLDMEDADSYLFSQHTGLVEPCVTLGDMVSKGDLIARIHITERTAVPPYEYHAPRDGVIIGRHVPSLVKMGDCLSVIAAIL
jgi:N-alpha-acetyl-L-2,4-diaminobutyrate deacetylase